ncbi:F-box/kelch-repeat protein At3g23880-like [Silene latifolia]|uniref:F-box/kelch-repeat protein At3g23880-like n=1 Tax=Silene latifolia TaxID=37657 RepID=UPI003D789A30
METTRNLPDDILEEEILVRLPVKCLLRWKCVCKHWYALFGDYAFALKHYRFQYALHIAHHATLPLFLDKPTDYPPYPGPEQEQTEFFVLSKHGADDVVLNVTPDFHRDIPPPFANEYQLKLASRCMGIVNGVIGLQWGNTCLALWNPATREFKDVPRWPVMPDNKVAEEFCGRILGLGFDLQSLDFKILRVIDFDGAGIEPNVYEYHLYSLKANSWKKVKEAPRSHLNVSLSLTDGYFNNGVYYWLANDTANNYSLVILAFDFSKELFTQSELPDGSDCRNIEHMGSKNGRVWSGCMGSGTLGKYKETLAVVITDTTDNSDCHGELWIVTKFREDDHVVLSWQLVVRVSSIPSFNDLSSICRFRECGDLLLSIQHGNSLEEEEGYLYDPATCTLKDLGIRFCHNFSYVQSLFSLAR